MFNKSVELLIVYSAEETVQDNAEEDDDNNGPQSQGV